MKNKSKLGWNKYPETAPNEPYGMHKTDIGDLYWDHGVWVEPVEYDGWNPPSHQPRMFYVVPDFNVGDL